MIVNRIHEWAKSQPNKTAVIWNDVSLNYLSFSNAILAICDRFHSENLPVGGTAIVLLDNLLDVWIRVMALRALGLNTICVQSTEDAVSLGMRNVACVVIAQNDAAAAHKLALKAISAVKVVTASPWISSAKETSEILIAPQEGSFGGHILYTSGTTGAHKKVMLSGDLEDRRNRARAQDLSLGSNTVCHALNNLPWTGGGFKNPSATWYVGGCVVFDERKEKFEKFFSHGVNFAVLLPWQLKTLLQARETLARPVAGFALVVGGGFLSIDLAEQSLQRLTDAITILYNSTEINSLRLRSYFKTKDDLYWFSPTDDSFIQIVDGNGKECAFDLEGELRIVLSEIDCHNYLDDDAASAKAFRHGCFYPGDMAVRRNDGRIRILGRSADVVSLKGEKLATAPLEQAIERFLQVEEVCLFSGLSEAGFEELIVAIRSNRGRPQKAQLEMVAREFPRFEKVRFSIRDEFPITGTGTRKTNRALLKKLVFEEFAGR